MALKACLLSLEMSEEEHENEKIEERERDKRNDDQASATKRRWKREKRKSQDKTRQEKSYLCSANSRSTRWKNANFIRDKWPHFSSNQQLPLSDRTERVKTLKMIIIIKLMMMMMTGTLKNEKKENYEQCDDDYCWKMLLHIQTHSIHSRQMIPSMCEYILFTH